MRREADGRVAAVEDDELGFEHDVAVDLEVLTVIGLEPAEAA